MRQKTTAWERERKKRDEVSAENCCLNQVAGNNLGATSMKALGKMLEENAQLESIDLSNNLIRGKAIDAIAVAVQTHPSLRALLLQWNSIGGSIAVFLSAPRAL